MLSSFFIDRPADALTYYTQYDPVLVALSLAVAVFGSYGALAVARQAGRSRLRLHRVLWRSMGAVCLGTGVWSMHFVGMLALTLPCTTAHNPWLTALSGAPAVLACFLAIDVISRDYPGWRRMLIGGVLIGVGIGLMHYMGMSAMRFAGYVRYQPALFALSLVVAVALATLALWVNARLLRARGDWADYAHPIGAVLLGLAASGMHYTAMAAAYFVRDDLALPVAASALTPPTVSSLVLAAAALIVILVLVASSIGSGTIRSPARNYSLVLTLMGFWFFGAWISAQTYYHHLGDELLARERERSAQEAIQIASGMEEMIRTVRGVTRLLAHDDDTLAVLRHHQRTWSSRVMDAAARKTAWSQDAKFDTLNGEFRRTAQSLGVDNIYILTEQGDCIVAANANTPESFIGANYAHRDYFLTARNGLPGHQYAVGQTSHVPGLYYSYPVRDGERIIGALVVKRDIHRFAAWSSLTSAFLVDGNGVVILAQDKSLESRILPHGAGARLPRDKLQLQYSKAVLRPLEVMAWQPERFPGAQILDGRLPPVVMSPSTVGDDHLTLYVPRPLPELLRYDIEQLWLFALLTLTGSMLILAASAMLMYARNIRRTHADLKVSAIAFEVQEGIAITDPDCVVVRVNRAFTRITGYAVADIVGRRISTLSSGRHDKEFYAAMWDRIRRTGSWEGEIWNRRKNGQIFPEFLTITAVRDSDGQITHYVGSFSDISASKEAAEQIERLAYFDVLTQLPNRRLLLDRLKHALASCARNGRPGAILFIDLDNFKTLNDTLGHDVGDLLLQHVAQRLQQCVREGDTVARLGGDEFVVMLENLSPHPAEAAGEARTVGTKIQTVITQPFQLGSHQCQTSPSIGAVLFGQRSESMEDLLKQADIAMYQAKKAGRNNLRFFDLEMQIVLNARAQTEAELRAAIDQGQLRVFYQVQVDQSGRAVGAEALVRWQHPERGLVLPVQFIALAEETGLIIPLGLVVLDTACTQLHRWQQHSLTRHLNLSVNVSARQFLQPDFVERVRDAVTRHAIDPSHLKLELTESQLPDKVQDVIATMQALRQLGVGFSLDDFGTGYSSLQYLKELPLDQLKIDRSFVNDLVSDGNDRAIVRTIIAMAQSLGLDVIAEGVESAEQQRLLTRKGCRLFQGYLFGRPQPIDVFEQELQQRL